MQFSIIIYNNKQNLMKNSSRLVQTTVILSKPLH